MVGRDGVPGTLPVDGEQHHCAVLQVSGVDLPDAATLTGTFRGPSHLAAPAKTHNEVSGIGGYRPIRGKGAAFFFEPAAGPKPGEKRRFNDGEREAKLYAAGV